MQPCDGLICATPAGSTAYNLSNGGPVLVWGLDAMVLTFVAPHALHVRPLVVPRGADAVITNQTASVDATVLVDGHEVGRLGDGEQAVVRVGEPAEPARDAARGRRSSAGTAPPSALTSIQPLATMGVRASPTLRIENLVLIHDGGARRSTSG